MTIKIHCKARELTNKIQALELEVLSFTNKLKELEKGDDMNQTTGHTPGPWIACYSETNEFGGGNIRSDHHVDGTGAKLFEAGSMFHDYQVNRHEEIANLHLAAASPELLAAAIDMVEWFGEVNYDAFDSGEIDISTLDWVGLHKVLYRATAAIAKAKGGA